MESRPDYKKKVEEELEKIASKAETLIQTLSAARAGSRVDIATQELYTSCKSALGRVQKMVTEADEEDARLSRCSAILRSTQNQRLN